MELTTVVGTETTAEEVDSACCKCGLVKSVHMGGLRRTLQEGEDALAKASSEQYDGSSSIPHSDTLTHVFYRPSRLCSRSSRSDLCPHPLLLLSFLPPSPPPPPNPTRSSPTRSRLDHRPPSSPRILERRRASLSRRSSNPCDRSLCHRQAHGYPARRIGRPSVLGRY